MYRKKKTLGNKIFIAIAVFIAMAAISLITNNKAQAALREEIPLETYEYAQEETIVEQEVIRSKPEIKFNSIPLYNQKAYPDVEYGDYGTIASHGCGVACIAMIATYLTDEYHSVKELAERFGHYNSEDGSYWSIFEDTAPALGLAKPAQTYDLSIVKFAVKDGKPVVALMNKGMFSSTRHFVVITGITDDGKYLINDPNGDNWQKNDEMIEGFANGFTEEQVSSNAYTYWIYEKKVNEVA